MPETIYGLDAVRLATAVTWPAVTLWYRDKKNVVKVVSAATATTILSEPGPATAIWTVAGTEIIVALLDKLDQRTQAVAEKQARIALLEEEMQSKRAEYIRTASIYMTSALLRIMNQVEIILSEARAFDARRTKLLITTAVSLAKQLDVELWARVDGKTA